MLKICICSDNHGDLNSIKQILNDNPACDYYFHLGDSCLPPDIIEPFISVLGNCDFYDYPKYRALQIDKYKILMIHGNGYVDIFDDLIELAKKNQFDIVLYGHTHRFKDEIIDGIYFINPGSTTRSRDILGNCYAILTIDDDDIKVVRVEL